jgi:hypothetical protein
LHLLLTKNLTVESPAEAMLHENWMTLQQMERFGWENVRGGDFTIVESYRLQERLEHIYDFEQNKIKYYVANCSYLFGTCDDWHVYVLGLENDRFYIGSCLRLGKSLGEHFGGKGIAWTRDNPVAKVLELITIKPGEGSYLKLKTRLVQGYVDRYGHDKVRADAAEITMLLEGMKKSFRFCLVRKYNLAAEIIVVGGFVNDMLK